GSETQILRRSPAITVTKIHKVTERGASLCAQRVDRFGAAIAVGVNGARVGKDKVAEMTRKHALHPEQRMQSATATRADDEDRRRQFRVGLGVMRLGSHRLTREY